MALGSTSDSKRSAMRIMTNGYVLLSTLAFAVTGFAKSPPPMIEEPIKSMSESSTSWLATSKPSDGLTMGKLQIQFEATTLSEVMSSIKAGSIQHQGDAADGARLHFSWSFLRARAARRFGERLAGNQI